MLENAGQRYQLPSVSPSPRLNTGLVLKYSRSFATFTPSPFFLLSATLSSTLRVYNFATSKVLKTLRAPGVYVSDKHPCPAVVFGHEEVAKQNGLSVSSNSSGRRKRRESWVVTGSENGKVVIWDLGSRRVLQVLEGEGSVHSPVVAVAVSSLLLFVMWSFSADLIQVHPDGRTIASGSLEPERLIQMWRDDHEDA
jgi:COMPASS component SWD3